MANRTILIADGNESFAKTLAEELERLDRELIVLSCESQQKAAQYLKENQPALIAATRELIPRGALSRCRIALIADHAEPFVFSIQRQSPANAAEALMRAIEHRVRVIGVSSPSGGAGKTSVCIGLCAAAVRHQKRAFYLNLESIMGLNPFAKVTSQGFDKVIQQLDDDLLLLDALRAGICQAEPGGVHTFVPGEHMVDRDELKPDEIALLIAALSNLCCWDQIYVDMEHCLDDRMMRVWDLAARMVVVLPAALNQSEKKRTMRRELEFRQGRDVYRTQRTLEKIVPVLNRVNPSRELTQDDLSFGALRVRHRIPAVTGSDLVSDQKWFSGVRELMNAYFDPIYEEICP